MIQPSIVPTIEIVWPPRWVAEAVKGFQQWATVAPYGMVFIRYPGVNMSELLGSMYAELPSHFTIIPVIKPLPPAYSGTALPADDPLLWRGMADTMRALTTKCGSCHRRWSTIAGLDMERIIEPWTIRGEGDMDLRKIYYECAPMLRDAADEVWIHPSVYSYPTNTVEVRQRFEQFCRSVEEGVNNASITRPLIRWISPRYQGQEMVDNPVLAARWEMDWKVLKSFARNDPVALLYFYQDPTNAAGQEIEKWWDTNELGRAMRLSRSVGMFSNMVYPGVANWLKATQEIVPRLPRIT